MKRRSLLALAAVCILLCSLFSACRRPPKQYTAYAFDYFDTVSTVTGYADSQKEFDAVAADILSQLEQYHKLYSIYDRIEGVANLCTLNEQRSAQVDQRIIDLLKYAIEMYEVTGGRMNIAMGSVLSLWHEYRTAGLDDPENAALPPMELLEAAAEHTDITKISIDEETSTVTLTDPLMKLDVGAIAKGYATEQIARYLEEKGISGYLLNIGGNVRAVGTKPDGSPWVTGVEDPNSQDYFATVKLSGQSIVTSGSYQRHYTVDGKQYHHIIDPVTNMPAEGLLSVSVICADSGLADALSTALFCMTVDEGKALIEVLSDAEALWVTPNGEQTVSSGWNSYLK